jgi:hypothetical protein
MFIKLPTYINKGGEDDSIYDPKTRMVRYKASEILYITTDEIKVNKKFKTVSVIGVSSGIEFLIDLPEDVIEKEIITTFVEIFTKN